MNTKTCSASLALLASTCLFAAPMSPNSISGLDIWLTDAGNTFDGTTWSDSSGNSHDATAIGFRAGVGTYPDATYSAGTASTQHGGVDGLAFDGATDDLMRAGPDYAGQTDITVFLVYSTDTAGSEVRPAGIGSQAAQGQGGSALLNMATDGSLRYDNGNNLGSANPLNTLVVRVMRLDSGAVTDWINSGSGLSLNIGPTSTPSGGAIPNPLGSDANGFYIGDVRAGATSVNPSTSNTVTTDSDLFISQAAVYNRALTDQEVLDVADWMAANPAAIPEPGTLTLMGLMLGALAVFRRRNS